QKKLILSISSWLGGRKDFLGITYLVVVTSSFIISIIFMLLHLKNPSQNHLSSLLSRKRNTPLLILSQTKPAVCFYIVKRKLGERRGRKKMAKGMRFVQTWGEVAPRLIVSHKKQQQHFSNLPKLETIVEEGCCIDSFAVRAPKRIVIFLPLVLSLIMYIVLHKKENVLTSYRERFSSPIFIGGFVYATVDRPRP
ncbi:hypothetical protein HID58_024224, partial [Brassica napus]